MRSSAGPWPAFWTARAGAVPTLCSGLLAPARPSRWWSAPSRCSHAGDHGQACPVWTRDPGELTPHATVQVVKREPEARLLLCAPQGYSADLLASALGAAGVTRDDMLRIADPRHPPVQMKEDVLLSFSAFDDQLRAFELPEPAVVAAKRIIVMTCGAAGMLRCGAYKQYHDTCPAGQAPDDKGLCGLEFSHVLIDEAGQVRQPEAPAQRTGSGKQGKAASARLGAPQGANSFSTCVLSAGLVARGDRAADAAAPHGWQSPALWGPQAARPSRQVPSGSSRSGRPWPGSLPAGALHRVQFGPGAVQAAEGPGARNRCDPRLQGSSTPSPSRDGQAAGLHLGGKRPHV